jgi:preprotein translocase subunit SecB
MAEQDQKNTEKRLSVVKIYTKDFSFESPQSPDIFNSQEWAPNTNLNLRSSHTAVSDSLHEVVLTVTVDAKGKEDEKTIFLVELHQAGLFEISGYAEEEMGIVIGSFCPNVLFPYVRETIAKLTSTRCTSSPCNNKQKVRRRRRTDKRGFVSGNSRHRRGFLGNGARFTACALGLRCSARRCRRARPARGDGHGP